MVLFYPPFVPISEGSVKSTDEVHVLGKVQFGSLGINGPTSIYGDIGTQVVIKYIWQESVTSRENGVPQESKKVVLEVLDIITMKFLGASRGPESCTYLNAKFSEYLP